MGRAGVKKKEEERRKTNKNDNSSTHSAGKGIPTIVAHPQLAEYIDEVSLRPSKVQVHPSRPLSPAYLSFC